MSDKCEHLRAENAALMDANTRLGELVEELGPYKARWAAAQKALDGVERESETVRIAAIRAVLRLEVESA